MVYGSSGLYYSMFLKPIILGVRAQLQGLDDSGKLLSKALYYSRPFYESKIFLNLGIDMLPFGCEDVYFWTALSCYCDTYAWGGWDGQPPDNAELVPSRKGSLVY